MRVTRAAGTAWPPSLVRKSRNPSFLKQGASGVRAVTRGEGAYPGTGSVTGWFGATAGRLACCAPATALSLTRVLWQTVTSAMGRGASGPGTLATPATRGRWWAARLGPTPGPARTPHSSATSTSSTGAIPTSTSSNLTVRLPVSPCRTAPPVSRLPWQRPASVDAGGPPVKPAASVQPLPLLSALVEPAANCWWTRVTAVQQTAPITPSARTASTACPVGGAAATYGPSLARATACKETWASPPLPWTVVLDTMVQQLWHIKAHLIPISVHGTLLSAL